MCKLTKWHNLGKLRYAGIKGEILDPQPHPFSFHFFPKEKKKKIKNKQINRKILQQKPLAKCLYGIFLAELLGKSPFKYGKKKDH